jgi:multisubunit Na+/H+ antiporter MnhB subunit
VGATGLYGQLHKWGVGGILDSVTGFVSAPTAAMILLCMGYDFVPKEIPWKKTVKLIAVRLVIAAVLLAGLIFLNRAVLGNMIFEGALLMLFIAPPPFIIPVFTDEPAERAELSASLSAMTLLTMVLFAIVSILMKV